MKKLLSMFMTLIFVLSFGSVASAATAIPTPTAPTTVTLTKQYKAGSPTTTFKFVIAGDTVPALPTFAADDTITFAPGDPVSKTLTIKLPTYTVVGIHNYQITETPGTPGTVPWVTYDGRVMNLKVTVVEENGKLVAYSAIRFGQATEKGGSFKNDYKFGQLEVSKVVTGNFGDKSKDFTVKVTFAAPTAPTGLVLDNPISYTIDGGSSVSVVGLTASFTLKHGQKATFINIPYGATYTVAEDVYSDYSTTHVFSNDGKDMKGAIETVVITNNKTTEVDTGISLDSIPYILLLAGTILGLGVMVLRKRQNADF